MIKLKSTSKTNPNGNFDDVTMEFRAVLQCGRELKDIAAVIAHVEPVWNEAIAMINQAIDDCLKSDFLTVDANVEVLR